MPASDADSRFQFRVLDALLGLLIAISMAIGGYIVRELGLLTERVHAVDVAVSEIRSNRFTNEDGLAIWKEIADIKTRLATLPTEVPPKWFVDRVDRIEENQERMMEDMNAIKMKFAAQPPVR